MKKFKVILFVCSGIISTMLLFHACQKGDHVSTSETDVSNNATDLNGELGFRSGEFDYSTCPALKSSVYSSGGMLVFQDREHLEKCAICLEKEYDDYNDAYDAQYPNATPEQLDSLDLVNNFNEWAPYVTFEAHHNFASLRAKIENESELWLATTSAAVIDFDDDPDDSVPVMEKSIRTLLNENGNAKVGSDTTSLNDWLEKDFWDDCGFLTTTKYTFDANDDPLLVDRQLKVEIKVKSGLLNSNLIGEITNYRKINGNYKKKRATLKIGVTGSSFNGDCVVMPQFWSKYEGYKDRKHIKVNAYIWELWREAVVERSNPRWMLDRCVAHGYWDNDNKYYPVALSR